jgi:2-polyprenyl-3-methyl-5-hydroxy-6-metoxy-1,4-benzoquinol methylase
MSNVSEQSVVQDRWNEFGTEAQRKLESNPEKYIVRECPIWHKEMSKKLVELIGPLPGKRILELGCGLGELAVWLTKQGATVVAIDIGSDLIAAAKTLAKINQVDCDFRQGSTVTLPFDSERFDTVIGLGVLHHLSNGEVIKTLDECRRVLKVNGRATFYESVENSKLFNLMQNCFPVGRRGDSDYRPSILQRREWKAYVEALDDRDMTDRELITVGKDVFRNVRVYPYGFLIRLTRIVGEIHHNTLSKVDSLLFKFIPPLRRYSQAVLVEYEK